MKLLLGSLFFAGSALGAIALTELVTDAFSGRKPNDGIELSLRHQVRTDNGTVEVVEQLTGGRGGTVSQWLVSGQSYYSEWNGREHTLRGRTLPSRTSAWIEFFVDRNGTEYLDRLLREQFVRRDQLSFLQSSYAPSGDPKTWATADKVIEREDVLVREMGTDLAVCAENARGDQKRSVCFLPGREPSLRRLSWVSTETATWDFLNPIGLSGMGRVPRTLVLTVAGQERVRTSVSSFKAAKKEALATARSAARSAANLPAAEVEEALKWILRYR